MTLSQEIQLSIKADELTEVSERLFDAFNQLGRELISA